MLRPGLIVGVLLFAALLQGCEPDNPDKQQITGEPQQVTPPAATAGTDLTITADAAGPVKMGMPVADIMTVLPGAVASVEMDGEGIEWTAISLNGEVLMNIVRDRNAVALIRVLSPRLQTEKGVKVGENLQSAGEKLGGLTEIQWTEIESREFATFANAPANVVFQVIGDDGTAGVYQNGEIITNIASSSATIHSIWIMEN